MNNIIEESIQHAHANHDVYLQSFKELLRIPSVSTDPAYKEGIEEAVTWLIAELTRIGFKNAQALRSEGQPIVYGEWLEAGPEKPTVLVYAHYDVQPVEPVERWQTPPFEPTIVGNKLYARGAMDDKCGVMINLKAFESILSTTGRLPVNIKLLFEGEEESGSPHMEEAIRLYRELLAADLIVISDGGPAPDQPHIVSSVRGIVGAEVIVRGPAHDLHSGKFGGVVHNPLHMVGKIVANLHDEAGRVQIPGFYDDVVGASATELAQYEANEVDFKAFQQAFSGVKQFWGVPEYNHIERVASQPTCDVNGISGGYQGEGLMTVIPAQASFKVTMRLVHNQNPADIAEKFKQFIRSFECQTLDIDVLIHDGSKPAKLLHEGATVDALRAAYRAVWGKEAIVIGLGGSIPITGMMQQELHAPIIMMGFGIGDNQHAPNEYLFLHEFQRGIDTAIHFYHYLVDQK